MFQVMYYFYWQHFHYLINLEAPEVKNIFFDKKISPYEVIILVKVLILRGAKLLLI